MIETLNEFIKTTFITDKNMFGLVTIGIMAGMGVSLGFFTEVILRLLGIKGGSH